MGRKSKRELRKKRKQAIKEANTYLKNNQTTGKLTDAIKASNPVNSSTTPKGTGKRDYYTGTYYGGNFHKSCSHYPHLVAKLGEIAIFAATKSTLNLSSCTNIDLVVNCSQMSLDLSRNKEVDSLIKGGKQFNSLKELIRVDKAPEELHLDWSDGSDWPSGLEFWQELYDICIRENYKSIVFTCLGGHGRTGTALTSFLVSNSEYAVGMAEAYTDVLRDNYCESAIETLIQEKYLDYLETSLSLKEDKRRTIDLEFAITPKVEEVKKPNIIETIENGTRCKSCLKLIDFCACGDLRGKSAFTDRCPNCDHFMDLCDCTTSEIQMALNGGKEGKQFELIDMTECMPDGELTDKEQQTESNRQIIAEVTRQALKDYQWK